MTDSTIQTWECFDCGAKAQGWSLDQYDSFTRVHADCRKIPAYSRPQDSWAPAIGFIAAVFIFAGFFRFFGWL